MMSNRWGLGVTIEYPAKKRQGGKIIQATHQNRTGKWKKIRNESLNRTKHYTCKCLRVLRVKSKNRVTCALLVRYK
jgi:hypothetical protein